MKDMTTFTPYQRTIIAWHLARRTTSLVGHTTDPTDVAFVVFLIVVVAGVPAPLGDGAPVFDVDFHAHCLLKWLGTAASKQQCPMDRRPWVTAERKVSETDRADPDPSESDEAASAIAG